MFSPEGPSLRELAVQALSSVERGYDLLAPKFDHTPFRTPDEVLDAVATALAPLGPFGHGLDLCCGTGAGADVLTRLCGESVTGVDFSAGMLGVARRRTATAAGPDPARPGPARPAPEGGACAPPAPAGPTAARPDRTGWPGPGGSRPTGPERAAVPGPGPDAGPGPEAGPGPAAVPVPATPGPDTGSAPGVGQVSAGSSPAGGPGPDIGPSRAAGQAPAGGPPCSDGAGRSGTVVGRPRVSWVRADARALPFTSAFDLVVSFGAFGHFLPAELPALFGQVHSVLRPGGGFAFPIAAPARPTGRAYWVLLGFDAAMRVRNAVWRPPFVMYYRTFRLGQVLSALERAGFETGLRPLPEFGRRDDGSPRARLVVARRP